MNALTPTNFGAVSTRFAGAPVENDLGAGVTGGYGMIGYKGKVWSIRHRGTEQNLMRPDGDGPRGSIEVVILSAATVISKVWYEKGFEEGNKGAPDCFSNNGITPDPASPKKQCTVCKLCPRDAFGSAIKQDGTPGKGKSCSDSKRLAVVPIADIRNEMFGGPMLLRVPASSLNDVATYGEGVKKLGFPYYGVATRIAFDPQEAFPKFVFSPIRPLTDEEADVVIEMRGDPRIERILAANEYETLPAQTPEAEKPKVAFEQPKADTPSAPAVQVAKPATARRKAAAPVAQVAQPAAPVATAAAPAAAPPPSASAGGFGAAAPSAPVTSQVTAPVADTSAFEAELDKELEGMLGDA